MSSKIYTEEQFIEAVSQSYSYSEVCRRIGISPKGGNLKTIKRKIKELNLDKSHFTGSRWNKGKTADTNSSIYKKDISEILTENSNRTSSYIRQRLIKEGIKESKCECCGRSEWLGIPIPLELHHINEVHTDNRLENLLILCPNCHAMTDSHCNIEQLDTLIKNQKELAPKIQESLLIAKKQKEEELNEKKIRKEKLKQLKKDNEKANKETVSKETKKLKICPICGEDFYPKSQSQKILFTKNALIELMAAKDLIYLS